MNTIYSCVVTGDIVVVISPGPDLDIGVDVTICAGVDLKIVPNISGSTTGASFLWSTGETTTSIIANQSGTYSLEITTVDGCVVTDDIVVVVKPVPDLDLGVDVTLCDSEDFEIVPAISGDTTGASFLWSTGDTGASIFVDQSGTYSL